MSENHSYFPILIRFTDNNEKRIIMDPKDIPSDRGFIVLDCNVERMLT